MLCIWRPIHECDDGDPVVRISEHHHSRESGLGAREQSFMPADNRYHCQLCRAKPCNTVGQALLLDDIPPGERNVTVRVGEE